MKNDLGLIKSSIFDPLIPSIVSISYPNGIEEGPFIIEFVLPYTLQLDLNELKKYFTNCKIEFPQPERKGEGIIAFGAHEARRLKGILADNNLGRYLLSKMTQYESRRKEQPRKPNIQRRLE